mgnify:CR=1 FL=1
MPHKKKGGLTRVDRTLRLNIQKAAIEMLEAQQSALVFAENALSIAYDLGMRVEVEKLRSIILDVEKNAASTRKFLTDELDRHYRGSSQDPWVH